MWAFSWQPSWAICAPIVSPASSWPWPTLHPTGAWLPLRSISGVFAPTQLPLAVLEGILTVVVMLVLQNYAGRELSAVGYSMEG